jgi:hypothetical protein
MPDGACVVRYDGKRGTVWRVKFRDRPVCGVPGRSAGDGDARQGVRGVDEAEGRGRAQARLTDVERVGLRRPSPTTFAAFAARAPRGRG